MHSGERNASMLWWTRNMHSLKRNASEDSRLTGICTLKGESHLRFLLFTVAWRIHSWERNASMLWWIRNLYSLGRNVSKDSRLTGICTLDREPIWDCCYSERMMRSWERNSSISEWIRNMHSLARNASEDSHLDGICTLDRETHLRLLLFGENDALLREKRFHIRMNSEYALLSEKRFRG